MRNETRSDPEMRYDYFKDVTAKAFNNIHDAYKKGDYDSGRVRNLYSSIAVSSVLATHVREFNASIAGYSGPGRLEDGTFPSAASHLDRLREEVQAPKQDIFGRRGAKVAELADLVGFYHFLAGIVTDGVNEPTHGFSAEDPKVGVLETADFFYREGNKVFERFLTDWYTEEAERRLSRAHGTSEEDQLAVDRNVAEGLSEDELHLMAYVNGTKEIVLRQWQVFSERPDIDDSVRALALRMVEQYIKEIDNNIMDNQFDEGLVEDPASRPSPSAIGTLQFFPGRVE